MLLNPYYLQIGSFISINALLGLGVYVTLSTGQLSLGSAGFMGIGAYTSAILTARFHNCIPAGVLFGALAAAMSGVLIAIPSLRLRGVYLAIVTLGFGEILRVAFIRLENLTGGAIGFSGIPKLGGAILDSLKASPAGTRTFSSMTGNALESLLVFAILLCITLMAAAFFALQANSRVGRAFRSIEMDETAAQSMGINVYYYKVLSFTQGAFVSGLAGALYGHVTSYVSPADFTYHRAVEILVYAILGGAGQVMGPLLGASILTTLPEVLRFMSGYRHVLYGAIIVLSMIYRPQGLIDSATTDRLRKFFKWKS